MLISWRFQLKVITPVCKEGGFSGVLFYKSTLNMSWFIWMLGERHLMLQKWDTDFDCKGRWSLSSIFNHCMLRSHSDSYRESILAMLK